MGIADRDYTRANPAPRGRPATPALRGRGLGGGRGNLGGSGGGMLGRGRFGMLSMNTWLIIINVAVFVLGGVLFPAILQSVSPNSPGGARITSLLTSRQSAGRIFLPETTPEQQRSGVVDWSVSRSLPVTPGFLFHPIYDPKTVTIDAQGRVLVPPGVQPIGGNRFRIQLVLDAWGHFSTGKAFVEFQVWRFLTFQFLHANSTHLLLNMLGLWFVGWIVEEYLGRRRYLAFYLTCGIFGAITYLVLNYIGNLLKTSGIAPGLMDSVPALLFDDIYTPLVGASAGVFGILMAAAYIMPTAIVDVFFIIPMKMRTAVYLFLGFAAINLFRGGNNAGGDAAHVGGAIAGYYFIRHMHLLRDFFDFVGAPRERSRTEITAEVDRILDKVRREGIASLSDAERTTLQRSAASGPAS